MIKRLTILILALVLCLSAYTMVKNLFPLKYGDMIETECEKYGFEKELIFAQIFKESKFDPYAVSEKGAVGLMQIMPETGRWCAEKMGIYPSYSEEMLKNPKVSIEIGCWYLNYLYKKTGDINFALAAYNGGIANAGRWQKEGISTDEIPFPETRDYVKKIKSYKKIYKFLYWKEMAK